MDDVFVGSLMSSPVHTVGTDTSLQSAGRLMLDHGIGSVIVVDDEGQLEGILTATDFVRVVAEGGLDPDATVEGSMSADVITTTANESIRSVADLLLEQGFHHAPVVDDGDVIGVITTTDLTAYVSRGVEPSPNDATDD
ncbi:CBS domain-containing protein [Halorarius litoreus]|uniref:CBS domain-containing protein n=1 Tax=Halorarius litoreus TaxID=2962676 RepID=UPI0020CBDD3A|nr:CBS domain-containing protein [Halorarius litoreus]